MLIYLEVGLELSYIHPEFTGKMCVVEKSCTKESMMMGCTKSGVYGKRLTRPFERESKLAPFERELWLACPMNTICG
jgi:hypothetical protein